MPEAAVLRSDDPRVGELLAAGWTVVAESWGARLRLRGHEDELTVYDRNVDAAVDGGYRVEELDEAWADAVVELHESTAPDYPRTPATPAPVLDRAAAARLWREGSRVFGVIDDGMLVAMTAIERSGGHAETDFTCVRASHRRRGLAVAAKSLSIRALAEEGCRVFGTGGANVNAASLAMNAACGYVIEERWLSLEDQSAQSA